MPAWRVKLLFDGAYPICRREVAWLKRRDRRAALAFDDISQPSFDAQHYGLTDKEVTGALHAVLPDGRIVRGVDAIREAYTAVGYGWLVLPTRWPILHWTCDRLYRIFARNRLWIGRLFGRRSADDADVP